MGDDDDGVSLVGGFVVQKDGSGNDGSGMAVRTSQKTLVQPMLSNNDAVSADPTPPAVVVVDDDDGGTSSRVVSTVRAILGDDPSFW